jgi:hypothetical protein
MNHKIEAGKQWGCQIRREGLQPQMSTCEKWNREFYSKNKPSWCSKYQLPEINTSLDYRHF